MDKKRSTSSADFNGYSTVAEVTSVVLDRRIRFPRGVFRVTVVVFPLFSTWTGTPPPRNGSPPPQTSIKMSVRSISSRPNSVSGGIAPIPKGATGIRSGSPPRIAHNKRSRLVMVKAFLDSQVVRNPQTPRMPTAAIQVQPQGIGHRHKPPR